MEVNIYTKLFLAVLFSKSLIESVLDARNLNHIVKNRGVVPAKFSSQVSLADHQKAADYSVEKIKVNRYFRLWDLVVFVAWTLGGGLQALNQLSMSLGKSEIGIGLIFFGLLGAISAFLSLPQ